MTTRPSQGRRRCKASRMFEKIGMSARAMPHKRRPNKRGKRQIQWKLIRCVFIVSSGKCVDNEACNKPLPMLLFSARDNCDMSFLCNYEVMFLSK